MPVTSMRSQISSISTSWVELCRWHKASFLFSRSDWLTALWFNAAVRDLGVLSPFLLYEGTAVLKWSSVIFQSPRITGSTHGRLSGIGVVKNPSQVIPLDLSASHWECIQTPLPALDSTEMAPTLSQMPPCKCIQPFLGCSPGLLLALFQKLMTRYLKTPNIKLVFLIFWN